MFNERFSDLAPEGLFPPGRIVVTLGILDLVKAGDLDPMPYVLRHLTSDWGDIDLDDQQANDIAVERGYETLFSAYQLTPTLRIWILTSGDRASTTVMLPHEY